jgi:hypothetical protein
LFASREFQQTDQFFDLGFIQLMQRLVYLVPNGGVEFVQEIEPRLGEETKNLSAVIGRAFPAHELVPFQPIQQAGYTLVPVRSSSLRCPALVLAYVPCERFGSS